MTSLWHENVHFYRLKTWRFLAVYSHVDVRETGSSGELYRIRTGVLIETSQSCRYGKRTDAFWPIRIENSTEPWFEIVIYDKWTDCESTERNHAVVCFPFFNWIKSKLTLPGVYLFFLFFFFRLFLGIKAAVSCRFITSPSLNILLYEYFSVP